MKTTTKLYWVAVLYFADGFPFGIVKDTLNATYQEPLPTA